MVAVPGRICIMGEHSDWSGGFRRFNPKIDPGRCIVCGTNQKIYAEVKPHGTQFIMTSTDNNGKRHGPMSVPLEKSILLKLAKKGGFFSYAAGVVYVILSQYKVGGLEINNYETTLPMNKGLSSSAALCVLVARAFNRAYDLKLTTRGEMEIAYQGELMTPSQCGRMDQACAFGSKPVVMDFDGEFMATKEVHVPKPLYFVVADVKAAKSTVRILQDLQACFPDPADEDAENLHRLLGSINLSITKRAIAAIESGDGPTLGALMLEAQREFDKYAGKVCPAELTAPVLHKVLAHPALKPLIWGCKGVGSQGDGCAQFLCKSAKDQEKVVEILDRDLGLEGLTLTLAPASRVSTALVPAAGLSPNLFPASNSTLPCLFPVVDHLGVCKPAILTVVEEIVSAGIEKIVIIVRRDYLAYFEKLFHKEVGRELFHSLSESDKKYAKRIKTIGDKITFHVQDKQEGFGHAVLMAREHIGDTPFLLVLGDHIYRSLDKDGSTCAQQIVNVYNRHQRPVIGLMRTPLKKVSQFGTVSGVWLSDNSDPSAGQPKTHRPVMAVRSIVEKPSPELAKSKLRTVGLPAGEFPTVFGMYVLEPSVFDLLDENYRNNIRHGGSFQLTPVLNHLCTRKEEGMIGTFVQGQRFDLGNPGNIVSTMVNYSRPPVLTTS